jgi:outer membrane receptor protein involved in Fe transport
MQNNNGLRGLLALVAVALALPLPAQETLEEIVVTARKREESLQEIPLTITVFDDEALDRLHITDLKSIADYTPGLTFDQGFVQQDTRPQIRGLPATRGRPPVGVLIDGIDVSSESMVTAGGSMLANLQLVDAERIEVVKGPQSALYGRVAFGGAVNYVTKQPGEETEGYVTVDVGDYGQLELKGAIGGPVSENFGLRLNVAHASHDGFYTNSVSGQEIGGTESTGLSLAGKFTPSDRLDIRGRIMYSESEWEPRAQTALILATEQSAIVPLDPDVAAIVAGTPMANPVFAPIPGELRALPEVQLSLDPLTGADNKGATLDSLLANVIIDYQLTDNITLSSWTAYTDADATGDQDTDFYGLPWEAVSLPAPAGVNEPVNNFNTQDILTETRQISQEFRLSDLESDGLRWAVGTLYWREDVAQQNRNIITVLFGIPGFPASAGHNLALQPSLPDYQPEWRDTEHWSVYGLLEFDFTDRLTGSVEARYSDEDFDQGWLVGGIGAFGFVAPFLPFSAPLNVGDIDTATTSDDFFTPRVSLEFQANDDMLLYGTISKGAKPGGVSSIFGTNADTGRFFPEELWNYEAGIKTTLADGKVFLNAAVFYMDYSDRQITSLEPSELVETGFALFVRNAAEAEVTGIELDATLNLWEGLTLTAAYTYLDAEYTDFKTTTSGALGVALAGNCELITSGATAACITDFTGRPLERIPEHGLVASALYRRPIGGDREFAFDVTLQYQDERPQGNDFLHVFPSYTVIDTRIGVETDNWSAYLYADNLTDDDTTKSGQGYGDLGALGSLAITTFSPDKRQVGARFTYRF